MNGPRVSVTKVATVVAINVIVFCVLAELAALLFHFVETGRVFYLDRPVYEPVGDAPAGQLTADVLNPYFGPSHRSGIPFEIPPELREAGRESPRVATNNFGFASPYNFPIVRSGDEFIIGIVGGSVAVWFCQVGVERLVADLQQHEFFKARTLVPLCMAHEGYKQPQQLQVLAYFLSIGQSFDLVINIDGFNEVALSPLNNQQNLDISMPSASHFLPLINLIDQGTLTLPKLQSLTAIARYRERLNGLAATLDGNRSAAVDAVLSRYRIWLMGRYNRELQVFDGLAATASGNSLIGAIPPTEERSGAMLFEDIARNWAKASLLMRSMLTAQGTPYVHVLQPNQYHTTRTFTAQESAVAHSSASPFRAGVEQGYPLLLAAAAAQGLVTQTGFFDGTRIFDSEPTPVYIDNCCHYTRVGNVRLADFIARAIITVPGRWNSAVPR
jgi:hypothetical protein